MSVFGLEEGKIYFPDPTQADDDGLLAVGGDLSLDRLILAYSYGIFPWYDPGDPILWWCPKERFIIRPSKIHISKSMRKFLRRHETYIRLNRDFADTMHRCRTKREYDEGTWISDEMEEAYGRLYDEGLAISVEAFVDGELAGGLYGVMMGRCFYGESMFSDRPNGSKVALILLARMLEENDFVFIDCQLHTDHLESMGGEYISYAEYCDLLTEGLYEPVFPEDEEYDEYDEPEAPGDGAHDELEALGDGAHDELEALGDEEHDEPEAPTDAPFEDETEDC